MHGIMGLHGIPPEILPHYLSPLLYLLRLMQVACKCVCDDGGGFGQLRTSEN